MNKKWMQIFFSLILALTLSAFMLVFASAEETEPAEDAPRVLYISTEKQFLIFAEDCRLDSYSQGLTVYLKQDLDLTGLDFQGIPIFGGTFEGQGHRIRGIAINTAGSNLGLFRYVTESGIIRNLKAEGTVTPEGSQTNIGGIVGSNAGTVENCRFEGTVSGGDQVGGIAGSNRLTGILSACEFRGAIRANHFMGGIAGDNKGVIRNCVNAASVNTSAAENNIQITSITIDTITGTEDANTVTDVGGIAGTNIGVIRDCVNRGDVGYPHMGYNIGGIAGSQSGYITGCQNFGSIWGRKETGGIAGQFEPVSQIEFREDTLQILEQQLAGASAALNRASYNAQSNLGVIGDSLESMRYDADAAREAISHMQPGETMDPDTILAAGNTLQESLYRMHSTMESMGEAAGATAGQLNEDLKVLAGQMSAMGRTIREAPETTGATLTDVSDRDTEENLTGKISYCKNTGSISGDLNAGGIVGSIAFENDLDPEEDLRISGSRSMNIEGSLRAVILSCQNSGTVSVKKIHAGGIVGRMTLGLAKDCRNTGIVEGEKAQYVGGIAGFSRGYLRSCHVKCRLKGSACVGGIAGSGTIVTDCLSMVTIPVGQEKLGAILGIQEECQDESVEIPVSGNLYLGLSEDPGGIDGISYQGQAEPLPPYKFQKLENLPEAFRTTTLLFRSEDGYEEKLELPMGSILRPETIPPVPPKEGYGGVWENLEDFTAKRIYFDTVFTPVYTPYRITIRSPQVRANGRPVLLMEGIFDEEAQLELKQTGLPELPERNLIEAWSVSPFSGKEAVTLHLAPPEGTETELLRILVHRKNGSWEEIPSKINVHHLIFILQPGETEFCVAEVPDSRWVTYALWAGAAVIALMGIFTFHSIKKNRSGKAEQ